MKVLQKQFSLETGGRDSTEITDLIRDFISQTGIETGTGQVFCKHTSASLMICENADSDVRRDMETFMSELAIDGDARFVHQAEGPDDMPAHIRSVLTGNDIGFPITQGRPNLGTWQGIYLWEHRHQGYTRNIILTLIGE